MLLFSAAALLGVALSLFTFVQKFPPQQRMAVFSLLAVGALLLVVVAIDVTQSESNESGHRELCRALNENRAALRTVIGEIEATDGEAFPEQLREAGESIRGPAC